MKPVIIIVIAVVLLIPNIVFAQYDSIDEIETKYNACIERANRIVIELLKQQSSQGSIIGYEGKFQKQEYESCMITYLFPLQDIGEALANEKKVFAMFYFDKVLELSKSEIIDGQVYLSKAILYSNLKDYDSAIEYFDKVLEIEPNHSQAIEYKEIAYQEIAKSENICGKGTVFKNGQCVPDTKSSKGGGCLIATATYGSELAPQVQQLRELRDNQLLNTESGSAFINSFNDFYYSFSPIIADYERENPVFKEAVKLAITPMITSLSILNYVDMDSEVEVLGYGISLILLNVGMYVGIPVLVIVKFRKGL